MRAALPALQWGVPNISSIFGVGVPIILKGCQISYIWNGGARYPGVPNIL